MRSRLVLTLAWLASGCLAVDPGENRVSSVDKGPDPLGPEPAGVPTRYPILLTHGFNASPDAPAGSRAHEWSWNGIDAPLRADGHRVTVARVRPFGSIEDRARDLAAQVERALSLVDDDVSVQPGTTSVFVHVPASARALEARIEGDAGVTMAVALDGSTEPPLDCTTGCSIPTPLEGAYRFDLTAPESTSAHLEVRLDTKVHIIAHSMGGLDARYYISALGGAERVASLTTISSPHRGTRIADLALGTTGIVDERVLSWVAGLFGGVDETLGPIDLRGALSSLSTASAAQFDADWPESSPEDNGVYYQSWAGVSSVGVELFGTVYGPHDATSCQTGLAPGARPFWAPGDTPPDVMDPRLQLGAGVVANGLRMESNDGMSTVDSARWGDFQGCIPADHYDEVGQVGDEGPDPATGFDAVRFYRNVAFGLARHEP